MAQTPSTMVALGTKAPDFALPDTVSGDIITLAKCQSNVATVILFICNHCPFVKAINPTLVRVAEHYQKEGVVFVAISSNSVESHPQDGPELMREVAKSEGYPFPYLYDESQSVAKAYEAACTPDLFVYDKNLQLVYRGQFDSSRPSNGLPVTGADLTGVLDCLLTGSSIPIEQRPSIGCNIKWKTRISWTGI